MLSISARMPAIEELREGGARLHLVFLEASTEVLVRRFDDTRRRHPLGEDAASVIEAIERENRAKREALGLPPRRTARKPIVEAAPEPAEAPKKKRRRRRRRGSPNKA